MTVDHTDGQPQPTHLRKAGDAPVRAVNDKRTNGAVPSTSVPSRGSSSESPSNERLTRLLGQKKGPDTVMLGVLCVAFLLGLIGLAVHFVWIVALIVMAVGIGFTIANSRRDRLDIVNRRAERRSRLTR